jgi:hypothetical protein
MKAHENREEISQGKENLSEERIPPSNGSTTSTLVFEGKICVHTR